MRWLIALIFLVFMTEVGVAATAFPPTLSFDGIEFRKVGEGERRYGFFNVLIYTSALYVEAKSKTSSNEDLLANPATKMIRLIYNYDIDAEDSVKAWKKSLRENCLSHCKDIKEVQQKFLNSVKNVKDKQTQDYVFRQSGVKFYQEGELLFEKSHAPFSKVLLASWIGPKPPTGELKKGLLGR